MTQSFRKVIAVVDRENGSMQVKDDMKSVPNLKI